MKKVVMLFMLMFSLVILSSCDDYIVENVDTIVINEICSNNKSSLYTSDYEYYDWIELYNPNETRVYLNKYGISDDKNDLYKFKFSKISIKPKGYLIIYFDAGNTEEDNFIADFGLSKDGETLYLTMPNGETIDSVEFPKLDEDTSYGRYTKKGKTTFEVLNPSPNEKNESKPIYQYISSPSFSSESGFYKKEFNLTLTCDSDADIYYTLDSSIPTEKSLKYTKEILISDPSSNPNVLKSRTDTSVKGTSYTDPVDKGLVVRAIAIGKDGNRSDVITNTYFIDKDAYKNKNVVSLVSDSKNLVDDEYGIYVTGKNYKEYVENGSNGKAPEYNFNQEGRDWERECNFTLIEEGELNFSQECGMRIHGYGGRTNIIKSFNIYARNCYGEKYFKDPIFDNFNYTKTITLKYDRYSSSTEKFRDGFLQSLMADTNVGTQEYKMCVVFLNGEYWQTYMIMEKYSEDSIAEEYNVNKDDVVIIKEHKLDEGTADDYASYIELVNFAKTASFKDDKNYEKLEKMIDIDSFIDFYSTQLYYNHFDFSYKKNIFMWKTRTATDEGYGDGRWRWMLYDFDYAAVNREVSSSTTGEKIMYDYKYDTFNGNFLFATDFPDDVFFHTFMKNEKFKQRFVERFLDLANTRFNGDYVANQILLQYGLNISTLRTFFANRFSYIVNHMANYLSVKNDITEVQVITNKMIKFNSLDINYNYSGTYLDAFYLTLEIGLGDKIEYNDLVLISQENNKYIFKISGNDVYIKIS